MKSLGYGPVSFHFGERIPFSQLSLVIQTNHPPLLNLSLFSFPFIPLHSSTSLFNIQSIATFSASFYFCSIVIPTSLNDSRMFKAWCFVMYFCFFYASGLGSRMTKSHYQLSISSIQLLVWILTSSSNTVLQYALLYASAYLISP